MSYKNNKNTAFITIKINQNVHSTYSTVTPKGGLGPINPNYISGFIQSDGSFFVSIAKNQKSKFGLRVRPKLSLTQDLDSIIVLNKIQEYFKCGYITINHKTHSAELVISSLSDLKNIIIPHIEKYPVYSSKQYSFLILKEILVLLIIR